MRLIAVVFLLALFTLSSKAQIFYGADAGWNHIGAIAQTREGTKIPVIAGNGFHAGIMLKVPFDKKLYFVPQLQYSSKKYGLQYQNLYGDSVVQKSLNIHYIELPLLLQYDAREQRAHIFFQFGPSISFAISGRERISELDQSIVSQKMVFDFYAYDHFEFNLIGRVGYQFGNNMVLSTGYALGLGSIVDDDNGPIVKPRTFTVNLGYWFR